MHVLVMQRADALKDEHGNALGDLLAGGASEGESEAIGRKELQRCSAYTGFQIYRLCSQFATVSRVECVPIGS